MRSSSRCLMVLLTLPLGATIAVAQPPGTKPAAPPSGPAGAAPPAGAAGKPGATPPPMTPQKPAPELETFMKGMDGTWKCETTMPAGSMGPGSPEMKTKSNIKLKKALDGFAYEGEWEAKKTKEMPGMKGRFVMTWDSAGKQMVNAAYDSMGATSYATGPISGDTVTLTGTGSMMGQKMKIRETVTRKPEGKEMTHSFEADMGQGWQMMAKDECKK